MLYKVTKKNYIFIIMISVFICALKPNNSQANNSNEDNYTLEIKLNEAPKELEKSLKLWQDKINNRPAPSEAEESYFNYRFEQDRILLNKFLESEGYYKAKIESSFNTIDHKADFIINIGEKYLFDKVVILPISTHKNKIITPEIKDLNVKSNQIAKTSKVIADESYIEKWIEKKNCLFEYKVTHQATINHLTNRVNITYSITYSRESTYGDITFSGSKTIDELYLISLLPIKTGECFKRSELNNSKLSLRKSNLLDSIKLILPNSPNANGSVPLKFIVTDKPPRTIKFGSNYSTDIGAGISAGWEHRNILSHGETISTHLSLADIERKFEVDLEKPFFIRSDQKLKLSSSIRKEDNEAYHSNGFGASGSVERSYNDKWIAGIGTKYDFEHIIDQDNDENTMLLSTPIFASQDKRDNIIDPQNGWTLNFSTAPGFDTIDTSTSFIKNYTNGTYYSTISESNRSVLALRATFGSIIGASSNTIPATERFYGGGGGSIRGYGYQKVSPLDDQNDPLGGRSLVELSTELRFRIANDYGVVPFIDCGSAFTSNFPESHNNLLCGAGIGLRYYTLFGPLRIDLAAPLNKRSGIDDPFQFYFSIGQAF